MKKSLRIKSLTLLLLLAVSIFPFKVFCHTDDSNGYLHNTLTLHSQSSHHHCPFCSFQFCHEFLQAQKSFVSLSQISINPFVLSFEKQIISFSIPSLNKGPPIQFM